MACNVQCSTLSIKCTCADLVAFAGAGEVFNVHFAVCRVQCAACQRKYLAVETGKLEIYIYV